MERARQRQGDGFISALIITAQNGYAREVDPFVGLCRETWGEEALFDALKDLPHGRLRLRSAKEAAKQQKAAEKLAKAAAKPAKATKGTKAKPATAPISAEATPAPAEAEEDAMPKITIEGTTYWHDESVNALYSIDAAGGFGDWVGYFQPDNEEEPIRLTTGPE
jgi:hypothetical protein